jgi:hypothetical protein
VQLTVNNNDNFIEDEQIKLYSSFLQVRFSLDVSLVICVILIFKSL